MAQARPEEAPAGQWTSTAEIGRVVIGTPAYGGLVHWRYAQAAAATKAELGRRGIVAHDIGTEGESLVERARDTIAAHFLSIPNASHLVFVDSDIEWQPEDFVRLLAHDVDVIAGLYPKKQYPIEHVFHPLVDVAGNARRDARTGAIEVENVGTGFLCIKRQVFIRLIESGTVAKYRMEGMPEQVLPWLHEFFPARVEDGIKWSEDYMFCRLWRRLGGRIWIDPSIRLTHIGAHPFVGDPSTLFHNASQGRVPA